MNIENYPYVSIILPIHNEVALIERSLGAVLTQDYPVDRMEILIADGISTDGTRYRVDRLVALHPQIPVHFLENSGRIVSSGLNLALRRAHGDIIIRVDGHCIIAPDYVRNCVEHIQNDGVDGVGGPMETIGETFISKVTAIGMSSPFGVGNSSFRTVSGKSMLTDTVPFPAYTRQIIKRAGLYDKELVRNQDDEYNYRIRELGGKLLLAEDVRSVYFSRSSLIHLWRQYFQYGYWKVRVLQKHPRQMSLRQFVPPAFVLSLIVSLFVFFSSFIFHLSSFFFYLSSFILILYLSANLLASLWTIIRLPSPGSPLPSPGSRLPSLFILPLVFVILHLSYGIGFLVGLLKFWNRWGDKIGKTPAWSNETVE